MNDKDFLELVARMRRSQIKYFATRSKAVLIESIQLEQAVDMAIKARLPEVAS